MLFTSSPGRRRAIILTLLLAAALAPPPATAAPPVPAQAQLLAPGALTAPKIAALCKAEIAKAEAGVDAIVRRRSARTFASVFVAFENVETGLEDNTAAAQFLYNVASDATVRSVSQQCSNDVNGFYTDETARADRYAALVAARDSHTARTPAEKKLEELDLAGAQRAGAGLAPPQRKQFVALEKKLTSDSDKFSANLANDTSTIALTPAQVTSLPPDFTGTLKTDAAGSTIVPVNESTYTTFLTSEADSDARKAFYLAYYMRGGSANVKLLQAAIVARDRVAHLLHYPNWAAYIAADRVAGSTARIGTFLHDIDVALLPQAKADRAQIEAASTGPFHQWDQTYYENQLRKSRYSVDRDAVKAYFPAEHVIAAVMAIYSHLLGLTFTPAPELPKWDPAVLAFDVTDTATGEARGAFYLDLYPRPGKFTHFANAPIYQRRVLPDGSVLPALNSILGNWPAPAPGKPSLLSHGDVITFFHEFGHNVAALCADTPYDTLNNGFRWDFVEAPSQMLENFVWDPAILKTISANVESGAPLPDDLIAKMIAARYFDDALSEVRQTALATIDQRYHTLPPPVDTTAVWKASIGALTPDAYIDGTLPQAGFTHLMNGYEAQYYGYLWANVYAQDMFTAFSTGGLQNPAVGMRYRKDILAPARMIEPDAEVRAFLGRAMDPSTFYRQLGIKPAH